jgi:DNA adenine methylase
VEARAGTGYNILGRATAQPSLFEDVVPSRAGSAPAGQLLKWIGNKQRVAEEIISHFPRSFGTYHEPFVGSGAVLATLAPERGRASDAFGPLMEIWQALKARPDELTKWYAARWRRMMAGRKVEVYEKVLASYNAGPNGADLLFICRSSYGGVIRFTKDGHMSTPCGAHRPIPPDAFAKRVLDWHARVRGTLFEQMDYQDAMERAKPGDVVYCDPPYSYSQSILYGGQDFRLEHLLAVIARCKKRGVFVALSIDGTKRSGKTLCDLPIPKGLFAREVFVHCGRSMLKRFQMNGRSVKEEVVTDRLLLTD